MITSTYNVEVNLIRQISDIYLDRRVRRVPLNVTRQEVDSILVVSRFSGVFLLIMYIQLLIFQVNLLALFHDDLASGLLYAIRGLRRVMLNKIRRHVHSQRCD